MPKKGNNRRPVCLCKHCHERPIYKRGLCYRCCNSPEIARNYRPPKQFQERPGRECKETMEQVEALIASVKSKGKPKWWARETSGQDQRYFGTRIGKAASVVFTKRHNRSCLV